MDLKKYKNILTLERWSKKDSKDSQILDLVEVDQNMAEDSNKLSEESNRD